MTFTPKAIKAALTAFKVCRPVERTACQDFGMQQDDIIRQQLEAALSAALAVDGLALQGWQEIESAHPCDPSHSMSFYQPPAASDREERR